MSGLAAEKLPETQSVIQYWICQPVIARRESHTYFIDGQFYTVIAYCKDYKTAIDMLGKNQERGIAEVEVLTMMRLKDLLIKNFLKFFAGKSEQKEKHLNRCFFCFTFLIN